MREADKLTAICGPTVKTEGSSISHNTIGLHGLLRGQLHFLHIYQHSDNGNNGNANKNTCGGMVDILNIVTE
jgi:hypothetical protein